MIKKINEIKTKEIIIMSVVAYIVTYGIVFNQVILNNDSIRRISGIEPSRLPSGRFMTDIYYKMIHGGIITPVISFFLGGVFLILGSYYLIKVLRIKNNYQKILVYLLVISYPIFDFFYAYGPDFDLYCLAFLISTLSIYFLEKKTKKNILISLILIIVTLGIYQAFLVVITGLLILKYILSYINELEINIKFLIEDIIIISLGMILYFITLKIILFICNTSLTSYRGADSISIIEIIKNIPNNIFQSYKEFFEIITKNSLLFNTDYDFIIINISLLVFLISFLLIFIIKNKKKDIFIFIAIIFLFVPSLYSINFIVLDFYDYIMFGYLIYLLLIVCIIDKIKFKEIIIMIILVFCMLNVIKINQYNLETKLLTDTSISISREIAVDLFEQNKYSKDSKVLIIGEMKNNDNISMTEKKPFDIKNRFLFNAFPGFNSGLKVYQLIETQGYNINYDSNIKYDEKKFKEAPAYPKKGYIYEDEGNYIIKLGDISQ